jgi:hypothetical protein
MNCVPRDVLGVVLSFVKRRHSLCKVSTQWCALLHLKRLTFSHHLIPHTEAWSNMVMIMPISLHVWSPARGILRPFISCFCGVVSITKVDLFLEHYDCTDEVVSQLGKLTQLVRLSSLYLNTHTPGGCITSKGLHELSTVFSSRSLAEIKLSLPTNVIGAPGAQHISQLYQATNLCTVSLFLAFCNIGDDGVRSLTTLCALPMLSSVSLGLGHNFLTDISVRHLVNFRHCRSLRTMWLWIRDNHISHIASQQLAELQHAPTLEYLYISLGSRREPKCPEDIMQALRTSIRDNVILSIFDVCVTG